MLPSLNKLKKKIVKIQQFFIFENNFDLRLGNFNFKINLVPFWVNTLRFLVTLFVGLHITFNTKSI